MDIVLISSVRLSLYLSAHPPTIFCSNSSERYKVSNVQATFAAKTTTLNFIVWVEGVIAFGIVLYRNQLKILQRTVLSDTKILLPKYNTI